MKTHNLDGFLICDICERVFPPNSILCLQCGNEDLRWFSVEGQGGKWKTKGEAVTEMDEQGL